MGAVAIRTPAVPESMTDIPFQMGKAPIQIGVIPERFGGAPEPFGKSPNAFLASPWTLRPSALDSGEPVGVELVIPGLDVQHEKLAAVACRERALNLALVQRLAPLGNLVTGVAWMRHINPQQESYHGA